MKIENDEQAYNTLQNSLGSLENKMRELYILGVKAGVEEGKNIMLDDVYAKIKEVRDDY